MAVLVMAQRLKDDPAGDAARDAGLDHDLRPGMHHRAPHSAAQRTIGVAVVAIGVAAVTKPFTGQQRAYIRHQFAQPLAVRARPIHAEQAMQILIPRLVRLIVLLFSPTPLPYFAGQRPAHSHRVDSERTQHALNSRLARRSTLSHISRLSYVV